MFVVRRPARVRLIAGLLACAWALLPVGTLIDALLGKHVYCAEHGAIEHAGRPMAAATERTGAHDDSARSVRGTDAADGEHGEICRFAQMTTREFRAASAIAVADAPAPLPAMQPPAPAPVPAPVAILAFAPKSSPPA
jgi:hypothetical protein